MQEYSNKKSCQPKYFLPGDNKEVDVIIFVSVFHRHASTYSDHMYCGNKRQDLCSFHRKRFFSSAYFSPPDTHGDCQFSPRQTIIRILPSNPCMMFLQRCLNVLH